MKDKSKKNLFIALGVVIIVIVIVALIGVYALRPEPEMLMGEAEASEYRVSGKVPGRIESFHVEEGQTVKEGDTLVEFSNPEVMAKLEQAEAARSAAQAQNNKALKGARQEQIMGAYEMWQKALVGVDIAKKSLDRVQALYDKQVVPAQKRDEVEAQ